jgi:hypothetical protein
MIDIVVSVRRDIAAAGRFFVRMLAILQDPEEVTRDRHRLLLRSSLSS